MRTNLYTAAQRVLYDLKYLFYPNLCISCHQHPAERGLPFCISCHLDMPYVDHSRISENTFVRHFYGRIPVQSGTALFYFSPQGKIQRMLHEFKYGGRPWIGNEVGRLLARRLRQNGHSVHGDIILPVPLHRHKLHARGYNQSARFAQGLSEGLNVPVNTKLLLRNKKTPTQTGLSRAERFANVDGAFRIMEPKPLRGKHVIIVDDVLTTGATLEAAALDVLKVPGTSVSFLTIAMGSI